MLYCRVREQLTHAHKYCTNLRACLPGHVGEGGVGVGEWAPLGRSHVIARAHSELKGRARAQPREGVDARLAHLTTGGAGLYLLLPNAELLVYFFLLGHSLVHALVHEAQGSANPAFGFVQPPASETLLRDAQVPKMPAALVGKRLIHLLRSHTICWQILPDC